MQKYAAVTCQIEAPAEEHVSAQVCVPYLVVLLLLLCAPPDFLPPEVCTLLGT
jgi:hypothetical protein